MSRVNRFTYEFTHYDIYGTLLGFRIELSFSYTCVRLQNTHAISVYVVSTNESIVGCTKLQNRKKNVGVDSQSAE